MDQPHYLYVMISKTDTGFGAFVRLLFGFQYNHCAMTLDPSFREWVAFGRFHQHAPLFGGFIVEPVERYLAKGIDAQVRIFRLEISRARYQALQSLFRQAGDPDSELLYNLFDAVATFFRFQWPIANAYTCLGFVRVVLDKPYPTIRHLNNDLMPHLFYEGGLGALAPDSGKRDDPYFDEMGPIHATYIGICRIARLTARAAQSAPRDLVMQQLQ